jgi:hypothetical protein
MLGFSSFAAIPFAAIRFAAVEAVSVSESAGVSNFFNVIGTSYVGVSELIESSGSFTANAALLASVQEELSGQAAQDSQGSFSVNFGDGMFVFHYSTLQSTYNVGAAETAEMQANPIGNTNSNVELQESAELQDVTNRRLLWEPIDDLQTPNWQNISTS